MQAPTVPAVCTSDARNTICHTPSCPFDINQVNGTCVFTKDPITADNAAACGPCVQVS